MDYRLPVRRKSDIRIHQHDFIKPMAHSVLKGEKRMKKLLFMLAIFTMFFGVGAISASAQVVDTIEATIPFDFTVRDTTYPAGFYSIKRVRQENGKAMVLRNQERKNLVVFMTNAASLHDYADRSMMVFHRIGDRYFLSEVYEEGSEVGIAVQRSDSEKRLERELSSMPTVIVHAHVVRE
jgi:hypothetical protein